MKKTPSLENIFSIFSLLIAFIIVHAMYVAVIRPKAKVFMAEEKANRAADKDYVPQRSFYVVVRDFEQEACFVLMLWACAILGFKGRNAYLQNIQQSKNFIGSPKGNIILPSDTELISKQIRSVAKAQSEYLLPRVLFDALERFSSTQNIQDASTVVQTLCEEESDRLDSELSIIRYIAWAIPSIGFIGTVRGIGDALAQAHRAVEGDITGVTQSLGVAFNSTFIALLISIVLMFIIHQIQLMQESLILDTKRYCNKWLISRLTVQ